MSIYKHLNTQKHYKKIEQNMYENIFNSPTRNTLETMQNKYLGSSSTSQSMASLLYEVPTPVAQKF